MKKIHRLAATGVVITLFVVVLGAWVRLSDAGLGCPDWPGCYGMIAVPGSDVAIAKANASFPDRPLEVGKAWKEMVHRYGAGMLGLLVVALAAAAWRQRPHQRTASNLTLMLVVLIVFQALLGMWTVTLLLKPVVVMAHLLGGFATLALLWWLYLETAGNLRAVPVAQGLRMWAAFGLLLVALQAALGGWTSANYAALACTDFPTCRGEWWPQMDFREAFVLWRRLGVDYEHGVLDHDARAAIQVTHRLGALVVLIYLAAFSGRLVSWASRDVRLARLGWGIGILLCVQVGLGIGNVLLGLPLALAVTHNGVAALLILSLVTVNFVAWRGSLGGGRETLLSRQTEPVSLAGGGSAAMGSQIGAKTE